MFKNTHHGDVFGPKLNPVSKGYMILIPVNNCRNYFTKIVEAFDFCS